MPPNRAKQRRTAANGAVWGAVGAEKERRGIKKTSGRGGGEMGEDGAEGAEPDA